MKRKEKSLKVGLLVLLCAGLYAFQHMRSAPVTVTLEEALAKKLISCTATSTGEYSGASVALTITNLSSSPLSITIPGGTVFKPSEEGDQDLIIAESQVIAVNAKATNKSIADGFCMEAHDSAPTADNSMKITRTTNDNLRALTGFLEKKGYEPSTIQEAVWAVSDGSSISYIGNADPKDKELRTFLSTLTKQPDPWYNTEQEVVVREDRRIETNPISVNGMLQFESDGQVKIREVVKNAAGTVMNTSDEIEFPKKGKWTYKFRLTVQGWEKGDYTIAVMNGSKELQVFPFSI